MIAINCWWNKYRHVGRFFSVIRHKKVNPVFPFLISARICDWKRQIKGQTFFYSSSSANSLRLTACTTFSFKAPRTQGAFSPSRFISEKTRFTVLSYIQDELNTFFCTPPLYKRQIENNEISRLLFSETFFNAIYTCRLREGLWSHGIKVSCVPLIFSFYYQQLRSISSL